MTIPAPSPETNRSETRELLLATAERLFAVHGLDAVSMRRIGREAGQLNTASIHYYFGSRDALIEAVVERRMSVINAERLKLIGRLREEGLDKDLREVVASYVRPLAARTAGQEGGNNYVRFLAQAYASNHVEIGDIVRGKWDQSLRQVTEMARALLPDLPEAVFRERMAILLRHVVYALADRERDALVGRERGQRLSFGDYVETIIDMETAALGAPCTLTISEPSL